MKPDAVFGFGYIVATEFVRLLQGKVFQKDIKNFAIGIDVSVEDFKDHHIE